MWASLPTLDLRTQDLRLSHLSLADGTVNGVLGVVSPITHEQYIFLEKVQDSLAKVVKGVGGLSHSEWRSFCNDRRTSEASAFIDGDLIESFLDLPKDKMEEVPPRHTCSACTIPCYVTAFIHIHELGINSSAHAVHKVAAQNPSENTSIYDFVTDPLSTHDLVSL